MRAAVLLLAVASIAHAQIAMPDPREMAGIPRPVTDLPNRSVSVRLIRGQLSNNIPNHPVELIIDGRPRTVNTDDAGRAQFDNLTPGAALKAVAVVDGERLESQEFPAPSSGGIRVMLVATDKERAAREAEAAKAPPVKGEVVLGGETRIVVEVDDERVRVFYLLDFINNQQTPIVPAEAILFDTPTGALSTAVIEGGPRASAVGPRVFVDGPFPPGSTFVQVGFALNAPEGHVTLEQEFPVPVQRFGIIAEKGGEATLTSDQIERQQEMPAEGRRYIAAAGGAIAPGEPLRFTITGLPHHSPLPRRIAVSLAGVVFLAGLWALRRPPAANVETSTLKRLTNRRDKLLQDLAKIDADHQRGRLDHEHHARRREELVVSLEDVYHELDADESLPDPSGQTDRRA